MTKRAAIYIRVSTELQGERASPKEQEKDCRALCERAGYSVAEVYRDTERYKVGRRLIEPSGTRADRPQFRRMLADAAAGAFEVIVAWKEDRLYRSFRAMLDFLDCIEAHKLDVQLVKETFDAKIAPVKAWAARMELQAKSERTAMGRAAKLAAGKGHPGYASYGHASDNGATVINPDEAPWVVQIWTWYADGVSMNDIRRELIAAGVPQRQSTTYSRGALPVQWAKGVLHKILTNQAYVTGRQKVKTAGRNFEIEVPALISPELAARVAERRKKNKGHPARNVKHNYLFGGLVHCEKCQVKASTKIRTKPGQSTWVCYRCAYHDTGYAKGAESGCFRSVTVGKLDAVAWAKVWEMVSNDALFEQRVRDKIEVLKSQEADAEGACQRIEARLDDLVIQRQTVMNWALDKKITESDMETKLAALSFEEAGLKRELGEKSLLLGDRAEKMLEVARRYRAQLRAAEWLLTTTPDTPEIAAEQFKARRDVVDAIVTRVDVNGAKEPTVQFVFDLAAAASLDNSTLREFVGPHPTLLDKYNWEPWSVRV